MDLLEIFKQELNHAGFTRVKYLQWVDDLNDYRPLESVLPDKIMLQVKIGDFRIQTQFTKGFLVDRSMRIVIIIELFSKITRMMESEKHE